MLPLEKPIVSIEYRTGELIPYLTAVLRRTIVDVRCTDSDGRYFIVEMQMYWSKSFNCYNWFLRVLALNKQFYLITSATLSINASPRNSRARIVPSGPNRMICGIA